MSGEEDEEATPTPAPRNPVGWMRFHEQRVLLQLSRPYGAVKIGPQEMVVPANMVDVNGATPDAPNAGATAFAEAIPGVLFVEPNGSGGIVLILKTICANGDATVALGPEMVAFCTMAERRLIHQATA